MAPLPSAVHKSLFLEIGNELADFPGHLDSLNRLKWKARPLCLVSRNRIPQSFDPLRLLFNLRQQQRTIGRMQVFPAVPVTGLGPMPLGIGLSSDRILIPVGIEDCSPGSRSDRDEHPGNIAVRGIRPRSGSQRVRMSICNPFRIWVHGFIILQSLKALGVGLPALVSHPCAHQPLPRPPAVALGPASTASP
jgi:hypothetical protein